MRYVALLALVAAACASARALNDVEYATAAGQTLRFDANIPDTPWPHPAAIIVHGGGWVTGDKRRSVQPLFKPLTDEGIAWFSINYRLARGKDAESLISLETISAMASASDDVRNAIAYIRAHAQEYNIDPERIVLIGESAGAHLASLAGLKPGAGKPVQGVIAFYSPSDLVSLIEDGGLIPPAIRNPMRGTAIEKLLLAGLKQISPRTFVTANAPPFLMIHGTADPLVPYPQSPAMCKELVAAGAACQMITVPGGEHGMLFWEARQQTAYKPVMMDWLLALLK